MSQTASEAMHPPETPTRTRTRRLRQPPRLSGRNPYSIFVGLLKVFLPAMAAALVLLVIAWPQLTFDDSRFRLGISNLAPGQAQSLTMLNARFDGIDDKDQPYTLTADMATQANQNEDLIELELPKADITLEDGTWLALTAKSGQYDRESELLDLYGSVSVFHDKGIEMRTEAARVDLNNGTAQSVQPVEGQGSMGFINAEGFLVLDRGERIIFTGKSRMIILPEAQEMMR